MLRNKYVAALVVTALTGLTVTAVTAVDARPGGPARAAADELPAFGDCADLTAWYRKAALPMVTPYGLQGQGFDDGLYNLAERAGAVADRAATAPSASKAVAAPGVATGSDGNGTNIQEAGVDEPDLVKTDGRHLFVLRGRSLRVVEVGRESQPRVIARLTLPGEGQELLLAGTRLLVIGRPVQEPSPINLPERAKPVWSYARERLTLATVDVSSPRSPRLLGSEDIDGRYVSARLQGGVARVVVSSSPVLRFPPHPGRLVPQTSRSGNPDAGALARNRAVVARATVKEWLPQRVHRDGAGRVLASTPLLECSAVRHPKVPSGVNTLSVRTVDLGEPDPLRSATATAVTATGDLVYASTGHLYVATVDYGVQPFAADGFGRGPADIAPRRATEPATRVHAFETTGRSTRYVASGAVAGYVLGQWAFSEHDGHLRVASTASSEGEASRSGEVTEPTESWVTVLRRDGDRLERVGQVGGLGRGERIRAVRWFGTLGVVVTFRQTDPLYTLDLGDPLRPRVLGELKIPGYSGYLHPVGDGLLLGAGQDADERDGAVRGRQVSLFDLRDLAKPRRVDNLVFGHGDLLAEHDSRAFTYLPDIATALLPTVTHSSLPSKGMEMTVLAVGVDVKGLKLTPRSVPRLDIDVERTVPVGDLVAAVGPRGIVLLDPEGADGGLRRVGGLSF